MRSLVVLIIISFSFLACNSTILLKKPEERFGMMEKTLPVSDIIIPLSIKKESVEEHVNKIIDSLEYNSFSFEQDGWNVELEKTQNLQLTFGENFVTMKVPLDVKMLKETMLADVKAEGIIALELQTDYSINKDWSYKTKTTLLNYSWLAEPKLKMGIINIPVESLSDMLIERLKDKVLNEIDHSLQKHVAIDELIKDKIGAWRNLIKLEDNYNSWLSFFPKKISMQPIVEKNGNIELTLALSSQFEVSVFEKPQIEVDTNQIPRFEKNQKIDDNSNIKLKVVVPFNFINELVDQHLIGQTFYSGKRNVTIQSLKFFTQDEKLMVDSELEGSYKGHAYFSGIPFYDASKNEIYLKDFDFDLETKNFIQRSVSWLFKNEIKDKIEQRMRYALSPLIETSKTQLEAILKESKLPFNLKLDSDITHLAIGNFYLTKDALISFIDLEATLMVKE